MKLAMTGISISEFCSFYSHLIEVYVSYTEGHERSICRKTYLLVGNLSLYWNRICDKQMHTSHDETPFSVNHNWATC